jgi:hypothetical protein
VHGSDGGSRRFPARSARCGLATSLHVPAVSYAPPAPHAPLLTRTQGFTHELSPLRAEFVGKTLSSILKMDATQSWVTKENQPGWVARLRGQDEGSSGICTRHQTKPPGCIPARGCNRADGQMEDYAAGSSTRAARRCARHQTTNPTKVNTP